MVNNKNDLASNGGPSEGCDFQPTHRVIASRGMSFPVQLSRVEGVVAHYVTDRGAEERCHITEIVPIND